ncbi:DUF2505 domain-containing protein [Arthrobacter sp. MYb211]|uniref:DUF2505 domain-containing protein n=1 Tax=Micrococcaceae TaxID=1268 RepID=UPI000BB7E9B0|nr:MULTISPECIES: DUF2505 domain-containing protein [Micrococcaceae]PCC28129.1 proteinase inhibitor I25 cystatin [Glutamicibacter sp. BW80]PQZ98252.1 DUF2505 domain-containing protein [Arthrobacter sp. MYb224]PRA02339.1 DUF2505 domain-containing protein [Arthrobacter sp. MYb229]PRA13516.1 DUF2505 domain-containing protein [Arthrobacter sp. MYb221]PRB50718.1 DUF2505 domain-containing protein [Arthrobacter sp. MYb216]
MALNASTQIAHPADKVIATLADRGFAEHLTSLAKGTLTSFTVEGDTNSAFTLTTVRALPTDRVPDFARKFVGASIDVTQVEQWSAPDAAGNRSASVKINVAGVPVSVSGTESLSPAGEQSEFAIDAKVSSSIPFIGGKLASAAEPYLGKALNMQAAQVNEWLSR